MEIADLKAATAIVLRLFSMLADGSSWGPAEEREWFNLRMMARAMELELPNPNDAEDWVTENAAVASRLSIPSNLPSPRVEGDHPPSTKVDKLLRGAEVEHVTIGSGEYVPGTHIRVDDPRVRYVCFPRQSVETPDGYTQTEARNIMDGLLEKTGIATRMLRKDAPDNLWVFQVHRESAFMANDKAAQWGTVQGRGYLSVTVGNPRGRDVAVPNVASIPDYHAAAKR